MRLNILVVLIALYLPVLCIAEDYTSSSDLDLLQFDDLNAEGSVDRAVSDDSVSSPAKKTGNIVLLLNRASDATQKEENRWIASLLEAVMEFKCAAFDGITLISPDTIGKYLPEHKDFSKKPTALQYLDIGKRLKADYAGIQKFEFSSKDKSIFYYMEIHSVEQRKLVTTVEKSIKINELGTGFDDLLLAILKEFSIPTPRDLARFIRMPAIGTDFKTVKQLGECIINERFNRTADSSKIAAEYIRICEKDRSMLVAYYRAGSFLESVNNFTDASEAYNLLFLALPEYLPVYVPLCRNYRKSKRFADALRIATLGEQRGIKSAGLISEKALAYDGLGKPGEAQKAYKQILEADSTDPNALLFFARLNNDKGNAIEAQKFCKLLISKKLMLGRAYIEFGRSLMLQSKTDDAIAAFSEAAKNLNGEPEPDIYLGDLYVSLGKYSKALTQYEKVLQVTPDNIDLYLKAASASEKGGDIKKALKILKDIEPRYSNHGGLMRELGVLSIANGDTAKAKVYLEASVRAGTDDERVVMGLGWISLRSGEYEKAYSLFEKALKTVKDKSQCKLGLAMVQIRRGNQTAAAALLSEVSASDLKIPGINKMIAEAFLSKGENEKALTHFNAERVLSPSDTSVQGNIARIRFETAAPLAAKTEYLKLVKMGGGGADAYYRLCILCLKLKDKANADIYLTNAQKMGSTDAATWLLLGQSYQQLGATKQALNAFENCIKESPSNTTALIALASGYEKSRQDSAAAQINLKLYNLDNGKFKDNLVTAATLFEKAGLKSDAKKTYRQFLDRKYTDNSVNVRLASLEFNDKNYLEAIKLLENLPPALINENEASILAQSYTNTNQPAKAIPHLNYLIGKNPANAKNVELLAIAYEKNNQLDLAVNTFKKYLTLVKRNSDCAFHIGELLEKLKDTQSAIAQYQSNTLVYLNDYRNFDRLARLYMESRNYKSALVVISKALQFKNASEDLRSMLAEAQVYTGTTAGAIENFKVIVEKNPNDTNALVMLGTLCFEQKKYTDAIPVLKKAINLTGANFDLYKMLGEALFKTADYSSAIDPLTRAHNIKKNDASLIKNLAGCYRELKDTKNLIQVLYDWVSLDKINFAQRKELAELLLANSKENDAISVLEDAVKIRKCEISMQLKLAEIYEKNGNKEKWIAHLQDALVCAPKNVDITFKIAKYFVSQNDLKKADPYLRKTILASPANIEANYLLGVTLNAAGKYSEAIPYLSKAFTSDKENRNYRIALSEAQYKTGKAAAALSSIMPVIRSGDGNAVALKIAGLCYYSTGKPDSAKAILQNVIRSDKNCGDCFAALGDIAFSESNFKDASDYFQNSLNINGYNGKFAVKLAQSYNRIGKYEDAKKIFEMVYVKSPQNSEAMYRLATYQLKDNKPVEARKLLTRYTGIKNGWYYLADAEINEAENKDNLAAVSYAKALKLLPDVPEVLAGNGRMCLVKKRFNDAIMYFGQAMGGDPDNIRLMLDLGKAYDGANESANASGMYEEVIRRQPDAVEAYYYLAKILSKNKDHPKAIQVLKNGIRNTKNSYSLYFALGHEYRLSQMYDDAIDAYLRAVKIDEVKCRDSYKFVGNIYYTRKDEKKAKKYYEMYINAGGNDPKISQLLKKLP